MAQYFYEFHDLTSDHENLVLWWAWHGQVLCSTVCTNASVSTHWWIVNTCKYMYVRVRTFTSSGSRKLEVFREHEFKVSPMESV